MLVSKDFRRYAREALKGRWMKAGLATIIAGFFGASLMGSAPNIGSYAGNSGAASDAGNVLNTLQIPAGVLAVVLGIGLVFLVWGIAVFIIGGAVTLGYTRYNLNLVDDHDPKIKDIFSQFHRLGAGFCMQLLRNIFVALWSLLLVIPGIIAQYRYAMAPYILYENPDMTASEAIRESKEMMKGNKWRLFCLEFSFIGWILLWLFVVWVVMMLTLMPMITAMDAVYASGEMVTAMLSFLGVMLVVLFIFSILLELFLSPYVAAAQAVFYREVSSGKYSNPQVEAEYTEERGSAYSEETFM